MYYNRRFAESKGVYFIASLPMTHSVLVKISIANESSNTMTFGRFQNVKRPNTKYTE